MGHHISVIIALYPFSISNHRCPILLPSTTVSHSPALSPLLRQQPTMAMASALPLLFFFLVLLTAAEGPKTHSNDVSVLKQLKETVLPRSVVPGSCLSSWNFSSDPCISLSGHHFTCGFYCDVVVSGHFRVSAVTLDSAGYTGDLSSVEWSLLPYLHTIALSNNFFSGHLPVSFSRLLRRMDFSYNAFSGDLPPSIGHLSNLQELLLNSNALGGSLPATIGNLTNLRRLELQGNSFSGPFPDMGSLFNLSVIDGSENSFSGRVPARFPASLVQISMRGNRLTGSIPTEIKGLNLLKVVDLRNKNLSGVVPSVLFEHKSLQQLSLSCNKLSSLQITGGGRAQKSLLEAVDLSNNRLRGQLPPELAKMPRLVSLSLENNELTGKVPVEYARRVVAGTPPLKRLLLGRNYLEGAVPSEMMKLKAGDATVSLAGNCLCNCPATMFFCKGEQKPTDECNSFRPLPPPTL